MLIFLLSAVLLVQSQQVTEASALGMMLKARYAMISGDYERALALAEEAMNCESRAADAAFLRVEILEAQGDMELLPSMRGQRILIRALSDYSERFTEDYRFPRMLGVLVVKHPSWVVTHRLSEPDQYLKKAIALMGEPTASSIIEDLADTYYHLGRWRLVNMKYFEASIAFSRVCELEPESTWAWYYAAQSSERSHQLRKALGYYQRFLKSGIVEPWGNRPPVDLDIALLDLQLNPGPASMEKMTSLLKRDDLDAGQVYSAAARMARLKEYALAAELLALVPAEKKGLDYYNLYSQIQLALRHYNHYFDKVLILLDEELDRKVQLLLVNYAIDVALLTGRYEELIHLADRYGGERDLIPRLPLFSAFGDVLRTGELDRWTRVIQRYGNHPFVKLWSSEAAANGLKTTAQRAIVQAFMTQQDWSGALDWLEANTDVGQPDSAFKEDLAVLYAMSGQFDDSFSIYDRLLAQDPSRIDLMNNYGYFLSLRGVRLNKAQTLIESALRKEPENAAYLDSMAWVHHLQGEHEKALMYMERALGDDSTDPEQNEHMGDILAALGRMEEARRHWSVAMEHTDDRYREILEKLDPLP